MHLDSDWPRQRMQAHMLDSVCVLQKVAVQCSDAILQAAMLLADTFRSGCKVLLCGNGGSAADCQHVAAELVSRLTEGFVRPGLPAIALTTDTSFLTAFANDCGYEGVFARQVQALGRPGDLLIAISTSGNSANVIRAVELAQQIGMSTIALTGNGGGLVDLANVAIAVPSVNTQYVQQAHLMIEHILCDVAERYLFEERSADESSRVACHASQTIVGFAH